VKRFSGKNCREMRKVLEKSRERIEDVFREELREDKECF